MAWIACVHFGVDGTVFWAAVQGIFTPIGIALAIYFPARQARKNELERVIAIRNIAHFHYRLTLLLVNNILSQKPIYRQWPALKVCWEALKLTEYTKISPMHLSEKLVDLLTTTATFAEIVERRNWHTSSASVNFLDDADMKELHKVKARQACDMDALSNYLSGKKVHYDDTTELFTVND